MTKGRGVFENSDLYPADKICRLQASESKEYTDRLLFDKLETVRRHLQSGLLVDLCCATGEHIWSVKPENTVAVGFDFSLSYLIEAECRRRAKGDPSVSFVGADARYIPCRSGSVTTLYSLSALYVIPDIEQVVSEISRILRVGGRCILDLGNKNSLNSFCIRNYYSKDIATNYHISVSEMKELCNKNRLQIIEHRAFQILPLWAGRPGWLWPLLHPIWKRILGARIRGRMIDEWICSVPPFRNLAFRHILVCEKCSAP
jgi:ubiquinone/menaquinone biosynthesis C-methylase UbiE